jgi:hypothetical protein
MRIDKRDRITDDSFFFETMVHDACRILQSAGSRLFGLLHAAGFGGGGYVGDWPHNFRLPTPQHPDWNGGHGYLVDFTPEDSYQSVAAFIEVLCEVQAGGGSVTAVYREGPNRDPRWELRIETHWGACDTWAINSRAFATPRRWDGLLTAVVSWYREVGLD